VRPQVELARLHASPVFRGRGVSRGDGGAVMTIPGLFAGDVTLRLLREWLRRIGHRPYASGIAFNADCWEKTFARLDRRVDELADRSGGPIALVGHSRGGLLARGVAHRRPSAVRCVVTLGSALSDPHDVSAPVRALIAGLRSYHEHVTDRRGRRGCLRLDCACGWTTHLHAPLAPHITLTSVYSHDDGVVASRACSPPDATAVEISGSHVGLAWNDRAYAAIASALAAP
jgi:triacylglycerol lipase